MKALATIKLHLEVGKLFRTSSQTSNKPHGPFLQFSLLFLQHFTSPSSNQKKRLVISIFNTNVSQNKIKSHLFLDLHIFNLLTLIVVDFCVSPFIFKTCPMKAHNSTHKYKKRHEFNQHCSSAYQMCMPQNYRDR